MLLGGSGAIGEANVVTIGHFASTSHCGKTVSELIHTMNVIEEHDDWNSRYGDESDWTRVTH